MESYLVNITSKAAEKLSKCTELLVGAGAGMGKDSGLPDFRGNEGFWNHYPPYKGKFNFY
jgi:NAD-dependent SIR2 family protein deacetylase